MPESAHGTLTRRLAQLAPSRTPSKASAKRAENYDPDTARVPGERWISMTNALTRAGHGLTLAEKRIVGCAVSKLDSRKAVRPGDVPVTRITAAEYAEAFGVDMTTAYEQLQDAAKQLYNRSITFYEAAHKRGGKPLPPTRVQMRWVGQVKYQDGEGWVELHWWPALLPHLTGLKKNFTTYQLQQASALRSVYSWRLLELLSRFESTGWLEVTIEDFAQSMDATAKQQENFANIRRKIIEPAVKELTTKDGWLIQWRPIKKGRKVSGLRFDFKRDEQLPLAL
uniref:Putative replication protein n=2 Tax=Pseudomonas sp. ZM1 TaxID=1523522 RepID=A0A097H0T6_9PSED|nr:putative replication protein [Pseudomonas sp. ZM1]AIT41774.1 putative replication protein [Pseudomonas sp. ZM1]